MSKRSLTEFGKEVKLELLIKNQSQKWLIEQCRKNTGMYVDSGLMNRLLTGQRNSPKLEAAIKAILEI